MGSSASKVGYWLTERNNTLSEMLTQYGKKKIFPPMSGADFVLPTGASLFPQGLENQG